MASEHIFSWKREINGRNVAICLFADVDGVELWTIGLEDDPVGERAQLKADTARILIATPPTTIEPVADKPTGAEAGRIAGDEAEPGDLRCSFVIRGDLDPSVILDRLECVLEDGNWREDDYGNAIEVLEGSACVEVLS